MATPKKLKNGMWRVRIYVGTQDGKRVYKYVTADTKNECVYKAALAKGKGVEKKSKALTVGEAVDRYIAAEELLSPTTLAGYQKIRRTMFADLMTKKVSELDDITVQAMINAECKRKSRRGGTISPKSVRNGYGLISTSIKKMTGKTFSVKLPEDLPKFIELPEPEEVIQAVKGTDIELPCMLALWLSLSMSEVRGLRYSSIRNGCLYIDQVVVDVDGLPVEKKNAKVHTRNRCLALPKYIEDLIHKTTDYDLYLNGAIGDGYLVFPRAEYTIRRRLNILLPGITFHQLRHMNASVMLKLGVPDKYAMERGGWSTPHTMKTVYQHTFSAERRRVDSAMDQFFEALCTIQCTIETAKP